MEAIKVLHKKKVLAPKLRFKGFDDGWVYGSLKDLTNLITKGTTPQSFSSEGINYVKIEGLVGININKEKCLYIDEKTHNKELRRSILQNNDILFAIAGATIGKVAIVTEDILPANTNQALAIIRLKNIKNLKYILQILQSRIMKKYIQGSISVGAQPNLNLEQMGDFRFHIPTLPEQQKIASFLSAVDEKILQLTRKKDLLEQYKKGVMQQLFSCKLRFKSENGKAYPNWEEKRLGDIGEFKNGLNKDKNDFGFGSPFVNLMDVFGKRELNNQKFDLVNSNESEKNLYSIQKGDVLFIRSSVKRSGVGEAVVVNEDLPQTVYSGFLIRFRDDRKTLDQKFKKYCFANYSFRKELLSYATTSANTNINQDSLGFVKLRVPVIEEQKKIANYLSTIDNKIENVNQQITQTQAFKKGLLQQMFV